MRTKHKRNLIIKKITQEEFDDKQRTFNEYEDMIQNQVRAIYADMRSNFPVMNFFKICRRRNY